MSDLGLALLRHGYDAIEHDRPHPGRAVGYATRMLGRRCVVVTGEAGARLFYDEDVVERSGAVPPPLAWLLFGRGAVHGLDDEDHHRRKELFLEPLEPDRVVGCAEDAGRMLAELLAASGGREVDVHDALVVCFGSAVMAWAGVRVAPGTAARRSREYAAVVDGFGFAGRAYARAWVARLRTDAWAAALVEDVRLARVPVEQGSFLARVATSDLDDRTAAVELGNVLRPTVAVSWLGAHAANELARPGGELLRSALAEDSDLRWSFAQEVRRTAPFVPALAGRVRRAAVLDGLALHPGDRVVLDVRGTNFSPALYADPLRFRPDRFVGADPGPYALLTQGGGPVRGHRCPGESMTLALLVETVGVLARADVELAAPGHVDLSRMPTLPAGGPTITTHDHPHDHPHDPRS